MAKAAKKKWVRPDVNPIMNAPEKPIKKKRKVSAPKEIMRAAAKKAGSAPTKGSNPKVKPDFDKTFSQLSLYDGDGAVNIGDHFIQGHDWEDE